MLFLNIVSEFVNAFLNFFLVYWLFDCFWSKKYQTYINVLFLLFASVLCMPFFLLLKDSPLQYLVLFLLIFSASFLFRTKILSSLFGTAMFFVIGAAIEMIVAFLMSWLFRVELSLIKEGILFITGMLLSKFVLFILIIVLRIKRKTAMLQIVRKSGYAVFVFPLATLSIILLQHGIFIYFPINNIVVSVAVLICYALLIVANILVFEYINILYNNTLYETKITAANDLIAQQIYQYEAVLDHHSEVSKMRHDQKNFCIGILSELKAGNIEKVVNRIEAENAFLSKMTNKPNDIISTLVAIKNETAATHNVHIEFEYRSQEQIVIPAIDLAVILGNALDNAIEATANISDHTARTIQLVATIKNKSIVVTIKNPVEKKLDVENLHSTKEETSLHGYGIISMKQIAERYDGDVTFVCSDTEFTASIILTNFCQQRDE